MSLKGNGLGHVDLFLLLLFVGLLPVDFQERVLLRLEQVRPDPVSLQFPLEHIMTKLNKLQKQKIAKEKKLKLARTLQVLQHSCSHDLTKMVSYQAFLKNSRRQRRPRLPRQPRQDCEQDENSAQIIQQQGKKNPLGDSLQVQARRITQFNIDQFRPKRSVRPIKQDQPSSDDDSLPVDQLFREVIRGWAQSQSVHRDPLLNQKRKLLPAYQKQYQVIELVNNHSVVLISGETGSGKSTQIPQFLYEAGYSRPDSHNPGVIGITQPRRIAAISIADRISFQLNIKVSHQVRFDKSSDQAGRIRVMTDGILLNQISTDFLLNKYSVIIIDQAHERKVNGDILIALLSRIIPIRAKKALEGRGFPLRLIIMSATLQMDCYSSPTLFRVKPPVLQIKSRLFPVNVYYNRKSREDYVQDAVQKCVKIHNTLPQGDVLVFLTGQKEIWTAIKLLQQRLNQHTVPLMEQESDQAAQQNQQFQQESAVSPATFRVLPVYSGLPLDRQKLIFQPFAGRTFIIATNVAQTSITVPTVKYVVDSGRYKRKIFDGIWKWRTQWISKAMAKQRAGRAGRVSKGYCYRLYSTAVYTKLRDQTQPQIEVIPLESTLLQLKLLGVDDVFNFPFPTMPVQSRIENALSSLIRMQALSGTLFTNKITQLGQIIGFLPLSPNLARMLLLGKRDKVQRQLILVAAYLSTDNLRIKSQEKGDSDLIGPVKQLLRLKNDQTVQQVANQQGLSANRLNQCRQIIDQVVQIYQDMAKAKLVWKFEPNLNFIKTLNQGLRGQVAMRHQVKQQRLTHTFYLTEEGLKASISPFSVLAKKKPQFITYVRSQAQNQRVLLHDCSQIMASELVPFCSKVQYMQHPQPVYSPRLDQVLFQGKGTYGAQAWELFFISKVPDQRKIKYLWFTKLLLSGKIIKQINLVGKLAINLAHLKESSIRGSDIVNKLMNARVCSVRSLCGEVWADRDFLRKEVQEVMSERGWGGFQSLIRERNDYKQQ